ncbi:MAG: molybdopterin-dependent oxidoreductase, partial [Candidatus Edwardsbacteria bacterium]|nr:molybdopterin-dependent oxidoreductase [Candidatus Edwardsbacteria bacterium]
VSAAQLESVAAQLAAARCPVMIAGRDLLQTAGADAGCGALADIALLLADRLSVLVAAAGANDHAALRVLNSPDGMTYLEMADALRRKKLKALVLAGEDPLRSLPGGTALEQAFAGAEFILAIDAFPGPAQRHAAVVLPLALPAEKSGRFSAMDGGEQAFTAALRPSGQSRPLNEILHDLAGRFRARLAPAAAMPRAPVATWHPLRSFAIPKQSPQMVLELGGVYPSLPGGENLVGNTYHLAREFSGNYVELNPEDIAALGVRSGWKVKVVTAAAALEAPVRANGAVPKGTAFMPVHFGGLALAPFPGGTGLGRPELRGIPVTIGKI